MIFIPSILSDQPVEVEEQLAKIANIEDFERIQIDVIDGIFADNITISPADFVQFDLSSFEVDVHLMTEEPIDFVHELIDHRQSLVVNAVIAQIEHMSSQSHFLEEVKKQGWKPGLSLDLHTPLASVDVESWEFIEIIQVMGIKAGFQGQEMVPTSLKLVEEIRSYLEQNNNQAEMIFDGGVRPSNVVAISQAGATGVSIGSSLWNSSDVQQQLLEYQRMIND
jgi:ribulose-phosphate 3-epimerase